MTPPSAPSTPLPGFYLQPLALAFFICCAIHSRNPVTFSSRHTFQSSRNSTRGAAAVNNPLGNPIPARTPLQGRQQSATWMTLSVPLSFAFYRHDNVGRVRLLLLQGREARQGGLRPSSRTCLLSITQLFNQGGCVSLASTGKFPRVFKREEGYRKAIPTIWPGICPD